MTREDLLSICERAIVPVGQWHNRDSAEAQQQAGRCWALLRAGCEYQVTTAPAGADCVTDAETIWLLVAVPGFWTVEIGAEPEWDQFYLPTEARLEKDGVSGASLIGQEAR